MNIMKQQKMDTKYLVLYILQQWNPKVLMKILKAS